MIRDITLGQYYPVNSILHRLDPRVKLFGTMIFLIALFIGDSWLGYLLSTIFLAGVIALSKVPFRFMVKGLRTVILLLLANVGFNIFLTEEG